MSLQGTDAYRDDDTLPALVRQAVEAARTHGFAFSCRPEQGRLLQLLAAGAPHSIAETGTGRGVGLARLASGAAPDTRLISIERDAERARTAAEVFRDHHHVEVLHGDWRHIEQYGPYDLLVLDGGGQAKGDGTAGPARLLTAGGLVVIDDSTPATTWPPHFDGEPDEPRLHWLEHPGLRSAELRLAADLSVIVGIRLPGG